METTSKSDEKPAFKLENLKPIVALAKRRGFVFPGSDIYGGFANTYSYGPYGAELKRTIKDLWWKRFVTAREDMVGLDGPILLHPKTWEASGHVGGFSDALVDCKSCKSRFRVDHLIEEATGKNVEGLDLKELDKIIADEGLSCPKCSKKDFTPARNFNLMFQTQLSKTGEEDNVAYLRPETAQAIFLDFKNIVDSTRVRLPFGVAQIGKAFRNEITPGNFLFRVIEFEQMEIEYFIREEQWESLFDTWLEQMQAWCDEIGLKRAKLDRYEHPQEKLSHYSKRTIDIMYDFPFGKSELYGLAYRTDFDLSQHAKACGKPIVYQDPMTQERFTPHVLEPTFGVDRTLLALLCDAYDEEELEGGELRTVLRFKPQIAPVKAAIFPLVKKPELEEVAQQLKKELMSAWNVEYDNSGNIGKRYRRQDELGTPYCITIDFDTLEDQSVTIRERDSMKQERVPLKEVMSTLAKSLS